MTVFRGYGLLGALGTLAAAAWLLAIPGDPKNAWLLGYSRARLALLLPLIGIAAAFLAGSFLGRPSRGSARRFYDWAAKFLSRPRIQGALLALAILGAILSLYAIIAFLTLPGDARSPVIGRLLPLIAWGAWFSIQTVLFIGLRAGILFQEHTVLFAWRNLFGALIVFGAAWFARGFSLGQFVTIDEPTWMRRGSTFTIALRNADFSRTLQSGHPGVTLMWAKLAGLTVFTPPPADLDYGGLSANRLDFLLLKEGHSRIEVLSGARFFIALANAAAIALIFLFASRLIGFGPALAGALLLAMDPFHAALTRLLAMDGTLASFMGLSVVAFCSFLGSGRKLDLAVSGGAAGLAWLTKSPGFILIPTLAVTGVAWRAAGLGRAGLRARGLRETFSLAGAMLLWVAAATLVFSALFPAMWVAPLDTLEKIFATALGYASIGHQGLVFWNGRVIPDGQITDFFYYPATFLWRATPVVLAGLLAAAAGVLRPAWLGNINRRAVSGLLGSAILIFLMMNLGTKRFDRYFLPVYPLLDLAAGAGLAWMAAALFRRSRFAGVGALFALFALQAGLLIGVHPYYLSYYNPLMGGPDRALEVMMIGWGEGLDQAGRYLSAKTEPQGLGVISWYNQGPFSYFYEGDSEHLSINTPPSPERLAEILEMDYIVIYIHQWQRNAPADLLAALSGREPEHTVWIDGLEYARVYRMDP